MSRYIKTLLFLFALSLVPASSTNSAFHFDAAITSIRITRASSSVSDYSTISTLLKLRGGAQKVSKKPKGPLIIPCPHCQSTLHKGGKQECPWKSLSSKEAVEKAKTKILFQKLSRIGIEALVGIILVAMGERRETIWMIILGALSMGAVLAEITAFLGEDALKIFGASIAMMAVLLLLQL